MATPFALQRQTGRGGRLRRELECERVRAEKLKQLKIRMSGRQRSVVRNLRRPRQAGSLASGSRRASAHSWIGGDERICPKHLKRGYHHQRTITTMTAVLTVVMDPPPIEISDAVSERLR